MVVSGPCGVEDAVMQKREGTIREQTGANQR